MADQDDLIISISTDVATLRRSNKKLEQAMNDTLAAINKSVGVSGAAIDTTLNRSFDSVVRGSARAAKAVNDNFAKIKPPSVQNFQTANIAAQFQDIGVTAAMGMSPLQIALQQGTQLSSVLGQQGAAGSVKALGAAFLSLVSPVSLVTIGLVAGGAALIQYFMSAKDGTEKADAELKKHTDQIREIANKWAEAVPALKDYVDQIDRARSVTDLNATAAKRTADTWDGIRKQVNGFADDFAGSIDLLQRASVQPEAPLNELGKLFEDLQNKIAAGTATSADFQRVQEAAAKAAASGGSDIKDFASSFTTLVGSVKGALAVLGQFQAQVDKVNNSAAAVQSGLQNTIAGATFNDNGVTRSTSSVQPAGAIPTPERRPNIELEGLPGELSKQEAATRKATDAAEELKKKQDDLLKSAGDRIAQMQQDIDLTGQYGVAADKARFALDEWQKAEKLSLNDEQKKALQEKIDQYGKLAETLAKVKLSSDLASDARLSSMSDRERQIVLTQRQYGLPEDAGSDTGQEIGRSLDRQEIRDGVTSFATDFKDALLHNGGDIGKAFGESIQNALLNEASKLWDSIFKQLGNAVANALMPQGGGAGGVGAVASAITGTAPVIPVTRAPLGDISSYAKAIQSIESGGNYGAMGPLTANGDRAYGAYQVMGANIPSWTKGALGTSMSPNEFLGSKSAQDAVFSKYFGDSVSKFGNPQDAASVWFTGRPMAQGAGAADVLGTTGSQYVDKFNSALGDASKNLGTFGGGLGQLGQTLSTSFFPSAPSAPSGEGGLFSWLGGLFGGGAFKPIGGQATAALAGTLKPGLFADGGHVAGPGGPTDDSIPAMLSNGEFVVNTRATRKHRALLEAINTGRVARFATGGFVSPRLISAPSAPTLAPRGQPAANNNGNPGVLNIQISGASGDDHVRTLVKQGVGEGLSQFNQQQERGGFGTVQGRYNNRKG